MGQYRQWLHHREIDQKLRAQLAILEQELAQSQEQAQQLSANNYSTDNALLLALSRQLQQAEKAPYPLMPEGNGVAMEQIADSNTNLSQETISPALFGWGQLPNFDAQELQASIPNVGPPRIVPPTPRIEDLRPEEVTTFADEQTHAIPAQIRLPWWFNDTLPATKGPVDQESARTNHRVQRWLERWRKPAKDIQESQKDQVK